MTGNLDGERMEETAAAIEEYVKEANEQKCDGIYVFATEAVRSARNRRDFVDMLARRGIDIDVVASQDEAKLGFAGRIRMGSAACLT